ncbi:MAG: hypothetical protein AAGA36_00465 [Pseudomonadota bacterium]
MAQSPTAIVWPIRSYAELSARTQNARQAVQKLRLDEAAFCVAPFRPRVRVQDKDPLNTFVWEPLNEASTVASAEPDIVQSARFTSQQTFGHARLERLNANHLNICVVLGLPQQMLTAAKADFKPDRLTDVGNI